MVHDPRWQFKNWSDDRKRDAILRVEYHPLAFIKKHHARIASMNLRDRKHGMDGGCLMRGL